MLELAKVIKTLEVWPSLITPHLRVRINDVMDTELYTRDEVADYLRTLSMRAGDPVIIHNGGLSGKVTTYLWQPRYGITMGLQPLIVATAHLLPDARGSDVRRYALSAQQYLNWCVSENLDPLKEDSQDAYSAQYYARMKRKGRRAAYQNASLHITISITALKSCEATAKLCSPEQSG